VYSRIVPHELLENPEFVDLHDDTYRLLLVGLNLLADDFGNLDANPRRLLRWACLFTQIKTLEALVAALGAVQNVGLVREYVVDSKPYLNLPRFRNTRRYFRRHCPPSPWCDPAAKTGPYVAGIQLTGRVACRAGGCLAKNTRQISGAATKSESELTIEVGVEEEKRNGDPLLPIGASRAAGWTVPDEWIQWAVRFREDQARPLAVAEVRALADRFGDLRRRKEGVDGGNIDWLRRWRNWVCVARAGGPT